MDFTVNKKLEKQLFIVPFVSSYQKSTKPLKATVSAKSVTFLYLYDT